MIEFKHSWQDREDVLDSHALSLAVELHIYNCLSRSILNPCPSCPASRSINHPSHYRNLFCCLLVQCHRDPNIFRCSNSLEPFCVPWQKYFFSMGTKTTKSAWPLYRDGNKKFCEWVIKHNTERNPSYFYSAIPGPMYSGSGRNNIIYW